MGGPDNGDKNNILKSAHAYFQEGQWDKALEAYRKLLELDPDDLAAASKLAELAEKTGQVSDAVEQYFKLGESFLKSYLYKKAQEMFKKVTVLDPAHTTAHLNLALIYTKQGSESDAKKEYLCLSEQALAQEDLDKAFDYAARAVELKSIEARYFLGIVLFKRQKWAEAKVEFESLLRFKLNHVGAQVYLAKTYDGMGQSDKAAEAFQKAMKIEGEGLLALEGWADYCVSKKNQGEAIKALTLLIDKSLAAGDTAKAVGWARQLVSVDQNLIPAQLKLAQTLQIATDLKGSAEVYYHLALIHENQNKPEEAAQYLKKTLDMDPNHARAVAMKSEVSVPKAPVAAESVTPTPDKISAPEPPQAIVVEVNPQEALKAQISIVDQYVKQGLLDEAIEIYQQLLEVDPNNEGIKQKLNAAYNAYVKTGTDLTGAFDQAPPAAEETGASGEPAKKADEEARKKAKEQEAKAREAADKQARVELEARAREQAEQQAKIELEKKAGEEREIKIRAEVEKKVREELERKARAEAEKRALEEAEKKKAEEEQTRIRLAAERKAREEAERKIREEMEQKAREEAERRIRESVETKKLDEVKNKINEAVEKKTRELAEKKAREQAENKERLEMEWKVREEVERKVREELERKRREEAEKKIRENVEKKVREESEKKVLEEVDRITQEELEKKDREDEKKKAREEAKKKIREAMDKKNTEMNEIVSLAEADLRHDQGRYEEALALYQKILESNPDHPEVLKKLKTAEEALATHKVSPVLKVIDKQPRTEAATPADAEGDQNAKKKNNKIGYV